MKVLLLSATAVLALAGAAVAQDAPRGPMAADADADGRLSQAEFIAAAQARFDRNDANRDGTISTEEMQAAFQGRREERRERIFAALDADSDGMISRAEFDARAGHRGEHGGRAGGMRHGRWGGRGHGDRAGADGVTRAEAQSRATAMFDRMDANDDGFLTQDDREGRRWGRSGQSAE